MDTHGFNLPFNKLIRYHRIPFLSYLPKRFYDQYGKARIYSRKQITFLLERAGFKMMCIDYIYPPFDKVKNPILKKTLFSVYYKLPKSMGVSIFAVCKK